MARRYSDGNVWSARCVTVSASRDSLPANVNVFGRLGRSVRQLSSNSPRTPFTFAQTSNAGLSVASVSAPDGVTVAVTYAAASGMSL